VLTLLIEFFSRDETAVTVRRDGESVVLTVDDQHYELTSDEAVDLQDAVSEALTQRREFFRTAGVHRENGTYEVTRRGADSAGNSKVFESFAALRRLFDRLPDEFTAEDVGRTGITGSRRHMLVRHFAEHPRFDCTIAKRNPLTAEKTTTEESPDEATQEDEPASETTSETTEQPVSEPITDETMASDEGEVVSAD
jgi:hypothetical protein